MSRARIAALLAVLTALLVVGALAQQHQPADPPAHGQSEPAAERQQPGEHAASATLTQHQLDEAAKEAAGEEDEQAEFKQSPSVRFIARITGLSLTAAYWVSVVLNFVVIAALILYGLKKALPGMFRERTAGIQRAMEEARKASEEANRRLSDIEGRLARLDQEIAGLRTAAEQEAGQEEERIRAAAEEDRQKVVHAAEQEIAAAARSARSELKAYVADLAVGLAKDKIQIGAAEDRELVRSFTSQLAKDGK